MSDKYAVPNKLPSKPVNVLTHRKRRLREQASHHHVKRLNRQFKLRSKPGRGYKKPEYFIDAYRKAERDMKRMRRVFNKNNFIEHVSPDEPKLLVVMRHRAHKIASRDCTLILGSLGLSRIHNTILLKNNAESLAFLKMIEPYVCYGYVNIQTLRDLIFKRGFLKINGKKTPINSNKLIEDNLGEYGCICMEDVVHELFSVSENFKNVRSLLLPFSLKPPRDGWSKKIGVSYALGGEYGNRKHEINALIERCL